MDSMDRFKSCWYDVPTLNWTRSANGPMPCIAEEAPPPKTLKLELESLNGESIAPFEKHGHEVLRDLTYISPPVATSSKPVIAVDLDDVLSRTNEAIAKWHNDEYGTDMDLSTFYYYYYWKNPFWGTPKETMEKVAKFNSTDRMYDAQPVPGAREGLQALNDMGYRIIVVTARTKNEAGRSWKWVEKHFPGMVEKIICTGQFEDAHKKGHEVVTRLGKAQVIW
ncbi:hypothetical protein AX15_000894 [Amanita polypyramis BW_CC]|nr:hypothetical protein AX15_000894 [Amanita polypyramis BW_CC]